MCINSVFLITNTCFSSFAIVIRVLNILHRKQNPFRYEIWLKVIKQTDTEIDRHPNHINEMPPISRVEDLLGQSGDGPSNQGLDFREVSSGGVSGPGRGGSGMATRPCPSMPLTPDLDPDALRPSPPRSQSQPSDLTQVMWPAVPPAEIYRLPVWWSFWIGIDCPLWYF